MLNALPQAAIKYLAQRPKRMAHFYWHTARDYWLRISPDARESFASKFPSHWVPGDPSLDESGRVRVNTDSGAGRDFLLMHRIMIKDLNVFLENGGNPPITGWDKPPEVGNTDYRVPMGTYMPVGTYTAKDDATWRQHLKDSSKFSSPDYLKKTSIDNLGLELEYGIHAAMHVRFGEHSEPRLWMSGPIFEEYDDAKFNTLFHAYSAHVHSWFWKIHGWIDARLDDWCRENDDNLEDYTPWLGLMGDVHAAHGSISPALLDRIERAVAFLREHRASGRYRVCLQPPA